MNEENVQELIDKVVAGRLLPEEEQRWNALLAERPELEEEVALAESLRALPAPPQVSTNFTALVMQQIARPKVKREAASPWLQWFRWPRFSRIAATAVVLLGINFAVIQHRKAANAEQAAQIIANSVQAITPAPEVEIESVITVFKDFEAISRLPASSSKVDYTLLAALQK
jgi:anti-sigma factor RsiW